MEGFVEVAPVAGIEPDTLYEFHVDGHAVLVALLEGQYYISDAHCPHMGGPLPKAHLSDTIITCPWHGSQFDLRDGSCLRWTNWIGGVRSVSELVRHPRPLRVYEVNVDNGTLYMGPQKPPGKIPQD